MLSDFRVSLQITTRETTRNKQNRETISSTANPQNMQGFSSSLKNRYKSEWVKNVSGNGPRRQGTKRKARIVPDKSKKVLKKRKKRPRVSLAKKY